MRQRSLLEPRIFSQKILTIGLEWTDLDFQRSEWRGHLTTPKAGRSREVPMTARLAALLKDNRHLRGPRVLHRDDGTKVNRAVFWYWMGKAQKRANLKVTGGLHILRHTFCGPAGDAGSTDDGDQGTGGARGHLDHAALHAPNPGSEELSNPAVGKGLAVWRRGGDGSRGDREVSVRRGRIGGRARESVKPVSQAGVTTEFL